MPVWFESKTQGCHGAGRAIVICECFNPQMACDGSALLGREAPNTWTGREWRVDLEGLLPGDGPAVPKEATGRPVFA